MIKSIEEKPVRQIEIDLRGTQGNAFYLMGLAHDLGKQLGWSRKTIELITNTMCAGDYDNLLEIFDYHFGEYVILYK